MAEAMSPIVIKMLAETAQLARDMAKAKSIVGDGFDGMSQAASKVKGVLAGLGVTLSAGAFAAWIKSSINAADETTKLAQKIGVTTSEVAGLQLAFRQSGVSTESMKSAMVKLSREIAEGNKAFAAMGIATKNADGSLRSSKAVLADVADVYAKAKTSTEKAAVAVQFFGKAGADLIPLLNQGGDSLREYDEVAKRLGITIDENTGKAAEKFNDTLDLVGQGVKGVGIQVASKLLPTLTQLAEGFFASVSEGDRLARVADVIAAGLKGLYSAAVVAVGAFDALGKSLGGLGAAAVAFFSGDFKRALTIVKETQDDVRKSLAATGDELKRVWTPAVQEASKVARDSGKSAEQLAKEQRDAAEAARKMAAAAAANTDRQRESAAAQKKAAQAVQKHAEEQRKLSVLIINFGEDESAAETARLKRYADRAREHAEMAEKIIDKEWAIAEAQNQILANDLERWREAQKEKERIEKEQADAMVAEQSRAWDQIAQSMTDALMDGGKNVAKMLQDLFRTVVLRPVLAPIGAALTGSLAPGAANAGGFGSLMSGISGFGGAAGAGLSNVLAGNIGGAFSAAGSLLGTGNLAGITSGLGMGLGAVLPALALVAALPKLKSALFGGEIKDTGVIGTLGYGGISAEGYNLKSGGLFGNTSSSKTPLGAIGDALAAGSAAMYAQVREYAKVLKLPAEAVGAAKVDFNFSTKGLSAEQIAEKVQKVVGDYGEAMAEGAAEFLRPLQKAGESFLETMARLAQLERFSADLAKFGGIFAGIADSSLGARQALVDLMGGIEALGAATASFVSKYYSESEQVGIAAAQVADALRAAGVDIYGLQSRQDYRARLESLNPETDSKQIAALLKNADAFAAIADYLAQTEDNDTLAQLAAGAMEQAEMLQSLTDAQTVGLETVSNSVIESGENIVASIEGLKAELSAANNAIAVYTQRTAQVLERVIPDGDALTVRTAA